jgi:polyhydroxybutyrate depolymerase
MNAPFQIEIQKLLNMLLKKTTRQQLSGLTALLMLLTLHSWSFSQQTLTATITHDGAQREYILYIPANYTGSSAVPLVLNYHGFTSSANEQMWYGDFRAIADTAGFLICHPEGTLLSGDSHWNVGGWTTGSTTDDVGFTSALIDSLSALYNINQDKVFYLLACELSDKIAAVASVTGSMTPETYTACDPQHPTPILQIHGDIDPTVPYNGAAWTWSIDNLMQYWVGYNNCSTIPTTTPFPDLNPGDGSTVEHIVYDGGDNGVTAEHMFITGGAHTWPGNIFGGAGTNDDINASLEIWKFFLRHDLGNLNQPVALSELNEFNVSIYPNPTNDLLNINLDGTSEFSLELFNVAGRHILSQSSVLGSVVLDVRSLSTGFYLVEVKKGTETLTRKFYKQ